MKKTIIALIFMFSLISISLAKPANLSNVEKVFGQKGMVQNDTIRLNFPRADLKLLVNGVAVKPDLAAVSWVAIKQAQGHAVMSADFALLPNEVDPVIKKLMASNIEITALKNHMYGESPKMIFLHCEGKGDAVKLAQIYRETLKKTKTPLPAMVPKKATVNWGNVESILMAKGKKEGTLIHFLIPRADKVIENETEITPLMGASEEINIQKIGNKAATAGDFALTSNEVNPVIKTLTQNGIKVTAIHNHTLNENPRTFYLHFWGYNTPDKLAKGLRAALNKINVAK